MCGVVVNKFRTEAKKQVDQSEVVSMSSPILNEAGQQIRVAILEDHRLVLETLTELLRQRGLQVVATASDPESFLGRIGGQEVDVVLIDLVLNGPAGAYDGGGVAILRELRQYHPNVRPIVLSGQQDPRVVDECLREGAWGFLDKQGGSLDAILDMIRAVASGKRLFTENMLTSAPERGSTGNGVSLLDGLTVREREVLSYLSAGADNLKIASHLRISERTVKAHVSNLYRKLGPENRAQLALLARQLGLHPPAHV
jgi:DNA-binding NarL/FixJ family response regulator